jgi:hypothetical protein
MNTATKKPATKKPATKKSGTEKSAAAQTGADKPVATTKAPKGTKESSKFASFIAAKKLDPRRIIIASRKLEHLRPEDRLIRLNKRQGRAAGDSAGATPKETRKPRSGRPVTGRAMKAALGGGQLSGPTKTRILRAVNHLLEQKKQDQADLRTLF